MILLYTDLEKNVPLTAWCWTSKETCCHPKRKRGSQWRNANLHSGSSESIGLTPVTALPWQHCEADHFSFVQTRECNKLRLIVWKWTGARLKDLTSVYASLESTGLESTGDCSLSIFPPSNRKIASLLNMSNIEQMSSCVCSLELL